MSFSELTHREVPMTNILNLLQFRQRPVEQYFSGPRASLVRARVFLGGEIIGKGAIYSGLL